MDVFIPEEYVIKRRMEKKAAANAENMPNMAPKAKKKMEKEIKNSQMPPPFRVNSNEFLVAGGTQNVVFGCLSA
ncbi:hypothetical protein DITRI_Ditri04bG0123700 [Diplodiscus trichospermus]